MENWRQITQDQWVLEPVQGYRIPFMSKPHQRQLPRQLCPSKEGETLLHVEIQEMLEKGAIKESWDNGEGLHIQRIPSTQEGRGSEICDKLEEAQRACTYGALQDGRNPSIERPPKKKRLDGKSGPEGCLRHGSDTQRGQRFPQVHMQGQMLQVQLPTIWSGICPLGFTKVLKPVAAQLRELGVRMIVYIDDMLIIDT